MEIDAKTILVPVVSAVLGAGGGSGVTVYAQEQLSKDVERVEKKADDALYEVSAARVRHSKQQLEYTKELGNINKEQAVTNEQLKQIVKALEKLDN